jgi:hypothetical protein
MMLPPAQDAVAVSRDVRLTADLALSRQVVVTVCFLVHPLQAFPFATVTEWSESVVVAKNAVVEHERHQAKHVPHTLHPP